MDEDDIPPEYITYLVTDDGWLSFCYVDWRETISTGTPGGLTTESQLDDSVLMHAYPLEGLSTLVERLYARLREPGLFGLVTEEGTDPLTAISGLGTAVPANYSDDPIHSHEEYESVISDILFVNGTIILGGTFDPDEVADVLTAEPDDSNGSGGYRRDERREEYGLYRRSDEDDSVPTFAVSEGSIIVGPGGDGSERIDERIDTATDHTEPATATIEEFQWLIDTAGTGHVVCGEYGRPETIGGTERNHWGTTDSVASRFDRFDTATGVVSSVAFEDHSATASFAAYYEEIDESLEASFRGRLASTANDRTVAVSTTEHRVRATGSWTDSDRIDAFQP